MARCARCNKFMIIKSQTGYCNDCYSIRLLEERQKQEVAERNRIAEEERRRKAEEAQKAEEERRRKAEVAQKAEEERRRKAEVAQKAEEERRRKAEEALEAEKAIRGLAEDTPEADKGHHRKDDKKPGTKEAHDGKAEGTQKTETGRRRRIRVAQDTGEATETEISVAENRKDKSKEPAEPSKQPSLSERANRFLLQNRATAMTIYTEMAIYIGHPQTTYGVLASIVKNHLKDCPDISPAELEDLNCDEFIEPYVDEIDYDDDSPTAIQNKRKIYAEILKHKKAGEALEGKVENKEEKSTVSSNGSAHQDEERKQQAEPSESQAGTLSLVSSFHTKLAGVTYSNSGSNTESRQKIIRDLFRAGMLNPGQELTLVQEPSNPYDDHAVAVFGPDGRQLGYLARETARKVFDDMNRGMIYKIYVADVTGGSVSMAYGVNVKIEGYTNEASSHSLPAQQAPNSSNYSDEDLKAQCEEAKELIMLNKLTQGYQIYRRLAATGYAEAQFGLGTCYDYGYGVQVDKFEATKWYERAASQGFMDAQANLGYNYANGEGVQQNYEKAMYWLQMAANQGSANAMNTIGKLYEEGSGVQKSAQKAHFWHEQSAENGDGIGMFNTGIDYLLGRGVAQDATKAAYWNRKAAELGNPQAQFNLATHI